MKRVFMVLAVTMMLAAQFMYGNCLYAEAALKSAAESSFIKRDEMMYVKANRLNVRAKPSLSAGVVKTLTRGTEVQRVGMSPGGSWSMILLSDGTPVYVASEYLVADKPVSESVSTGQDGVTEVAMNSAWKYADFSKIHSGKARLHRATNNRKGIIVCVNAGHGTNGGGSVKTLSHPDGSAKVTGGTTKEGNTYSTAVSSGMVFADGTTEASVTLKMALVLKDELLSRGYDVLMIRESDDVQLDNIARTVIANNMADCHIALHWDSTASNKGAFYMAVPDIASYKAMEPVASNWQRHNKLGESLISGLKGVGTKIFGGGSMGMDLTQTSYSTVPSVDIELGDKTSDYSQGTLINHAKGLANGVDTFFAK